MLLDAFTSQIKAGNRVLITGHTGFKGTWLTLLLENLGIEVCGLSLSAEENSLFLRLGREGTIEETIGDIRNYSTVEKTISKFRPEIIFHLAAQPLVLRSYKEPRETFETNVMGTVNILDASSRVPSVRHVSVITTDKVYKNENLGRRFSEDDALSGKDPYSASKVGTEAVVAAWRQMRKYSPGPSVTSLRAGNVIGGGDYAEARLLPDLVKGFSSGKCVEVRNPQSTRPWQHVLDPLAGYLLGTAHTLQGKETPAFNFAPDGPSLSVARVAEIAAKSWGEGATVQSLTEENYLEAETLQLDASLAKSLLSWAPVWSQEAAVQSTIEWWKSVDSGQKDAAVACSTDIEQLISQYS